MVCYTNHCRARRGLRTKGRLNELGDRNVNGTRPTPGREEGEIAVGDVAADQQPACPDACESHVEIIGVKISEFKIGLVMQSRALGKPDVSIGLMHGAKGQEFRAVAGMACDTDVLPDEARLLAASGERPSHFTEFPAICTTQNLQICNNLGPVTPLHKSS